MLYVNYILVKLGKKKRMLLSSKTFYSCLLGNMKGFIDAFELDPPAACHLSQ